MQMNTTTSASSDEKNSAAVWSFLPIFIVTVFILVCLLNGWELLLFTRNARLRTGFNVYLINLLAANVLTALILYPADTAYQLYSKWYMGDEVCTFYLYGNAVIMGGSLLSHALIAINRIWAMTFPISYKVHHTKSVAVMICVGMWAYVHLLALPTVITDHLYYRLPVEITGCALNGNRQWKYSIALQFLVYNAAEIIVVACYPYILFKRRSQRWRRRTASQLPEADLVNMDSQKTDNKSGADVVEGTPEALRERSSRTQATEIAHRNHAFLILTLTTLSVLVCWTPMLLFFTAFLIHNFEIKPIYVDTIYVLYTLQGALDPVYLLFALPELRGAMWASIQILGGCLK